MATATGFVCDFAPCKRFEYADKDARLPDGWVRLTTNGGGAIDLCSSRCLAEVAVERFTMEHGKRFVRKSAAEPEAPAANGARP